MIQKTKAYFDMIWNYDHFFKMKYEIWQNMRTFKKFIIIQQRLTYEILRKL
jgi:hypothetical protein